MKRIVSGLIDRFRKPRIVPPPSQFARNHQRLNAALGETRVDERLLAAIFDDQAQARDCFTVEVVDHLADAEQQSALKVRLGNQTVEMKIPRFDALGLSACWMRLLQSSRFLASCSAVAEGEFFFCLGDAAYVPGIAFCSNRTDSVLVADCDFLHSQGYREFREIYGSTPVPWENRRRVAYWRGSTTGLYEQPHAWRGIDRIKLCQIAVRRPDIFDVGISGIVQLEVPEAEPELRRQGLMRNFVSPVETPNYRIQIDIDGNSNAWSGLFLKLLSGSPVIKVASSGGFRQWYYDRLEPFLNFVPVAADMSDLVEKAEWLLSHDREARAIGEAGRALAMSMSYESEFAASTAVVAAALARGR